MREVDAGSCNGCELEIHALNNPVYDVERFGIRFVASPRHADVLLVTGPVTHNMKVALERNYAATPDPQWVVAAGDCAAGSGVFVALQFAAFSAVGALLWAYHQGRIPKQLGLSTSDDLYPDFILHQLPVVISGLLVAGILGAAMGSLSAALNSMANSTVADIIHSFSPREISDRILLRLGRIMTLVWAALSVFLFLLTVEWVGRKLAGLP